MSLLNLHTHLEEWSLSGLTVEGIRAPSGAWFSSRKATLGQNKIGRGAWSPCLAFAESIELVKPGPGMLQDFALLGEAEPDRILAYARKWGSLCLCEHGLPGSHNRIGPVRAESELPRCKRIAARTARGLVVIEPLDSWRGFARQAGAMLSIAARLHNGEPGREEDWAALRQVSRLRWESEDGFPPPIKPHAQRVRMMLAIQAWLRWGGVDLAFNWEKPRPTLGIGPVGLFGAVALELALAVTKSDRLAYCSSCARGYCPERRPQAGRNSFCKDCGRRAACRFATEKYRRRLQERQPERRR